MIVIPGKIPIIIHPLFWLFAFLIGWLNSMVLTGALIWVGIIFVSVLIHEFGHALTALFFKQKVQIQLVPLGGLTSYEGAPLRLWQQFLITFNGPLFGFFLFLLATALLATHLFDAPLALRILKLTQFANLFWTLVNLLPVMPLDGGQLLRIVLEALFGVKGFKAALLVGALLAGVISLTFFIFQQILIGALFFLFAFQSFVSWRKSRLVIGSDREEENRHLMAEAEKAIAEGKIETAKQFIEQIRAKTKGGVLFLAATQYLALFFQKEGKNKEAYDLLLPLKEHLDDPARLMLHTLAAEQKNYSLVAELSSDCYQMAPSQEVALHNARAFAALHQAKPAGGWLRAAWEFGHFDLESFLSQEPFLQIKDEAEFKEFVDPLR
jgi:stage IV sporulation protein FB